MPSHRSSEAVIGTLVAHGMFDLPLFELAVKARTGEAQWFAEFVATFGLITTILAVSRFKSEAIPVAVGLYITAAYWFTASTSFANPAVTIARAFTNSFAGIAPPDVPMFIVAQFAGALAGLVVMGWLLEADSPRPLAILLAIPMRSGGARGDCCAGREIDLA